MIKEKDTNKSSIYFGLKTSLNISKITIIVLSICYVAMLYFGFYYPQTEGNPTDIDFLYSYATKTLLGVVIVTGPLCVIHILHYFKIKEILNKNK